MTISARTLIRILLILGAWCLLMVPALAQTESAVKWVATKTSAPITAGAQIEVTIEATIEKGWHLYSVKAIEDGPFPTTFSAGTGVEISGEITESQPKNELDPNFQKNVNYFADKATFTVPVKVTDPKGASVSVRFQTCNDKRCTIPVSISIPLDGGQSAATTAGSTDQTKPAGGVGVARNSVTEAKQQGLLAYMKLAISAGFLALLTPCVFPMIPITVSFFSKRKKDHGMRDSVGQALAYCGGIIGTFTALGVIVAAAFGAAGIQNLANNPWLNLTLAAVFIVLALSLFGVFEIGLPSKFVNKFDASGKGGFIAPILMGLTFSLTSFTCTLPFVGAVLVSASQGEYFYPILGMLGFSTAFCLPFFALAIFPQALSKIPKSGPWMVTVKATMGFIELMAAVKFLSSFDLGIKGGLGLLTREVYLALWFMLAVGMGAYLLGLIKLPRVEEGKIGWVRRGLGLATMAGAWFIVQGLNGKPLGDIDAFLPPSPYPGKAMTSAASEEGWLSNYDQALAKAKAEGKPLFIDFTGIYCTNCRFMERNVFPQDSVKSKFESFVKVKLFTDRGTPEDNANQALMKKLTNSITLPTYVTIDGSGAVSAKEFTRDVEEFAKWLGQAKG